MSDEGGDDGGADADGGFAFDAEPASVADAPPAVVGTGPVPGVEPTAVVREQLDAIESTAVDVETALATDGVPASVRTLFAHAAPSFRVAHGDLEGFATTLLGPMYDRLVAASSVERGPGEREADSFTQAVLARHDDGDRTYEFVLERQVGGKYDDCWMTTSIDLVYDGESPSFRRTPTVRFGDREVTCEVGDDLRSVLLAADGYSPHNDVTQVANCGGNGLCGTCAVDVDGELSEMEPRERQRLSLPPHDEESGLRLSCQACVEGDVTVQKHDGLWGQHVEDVADGDAEPADAGGDPIEVTAAEYAGDYDYAAAGGGEGR